MPVSPIRAGTLGFISAISRSVLAIALLGIFPIEEESSGGDSGGGGSGRGAVAGPNGDLPWGEQQADILVVGEPGVSTMDMATWALGAGLL